MPVIPVLDGFIFSLYWQDDYAFYKNVLHELSLREGLPVPLYETIKWGAPHMPTFISMVEVDGEVFYGNAGRTKKKAEMKAAKVAYTALIERMLIFSLPFYSILCSEDSIGSKIFLIFSLPFFQGLRIIMKFLLNSMRKSSKQEINWEALKFYFLFRWTELRRWVHYTYCQGRWSSQFYS